MTGLEKFIDVDGRLNAWPSKKMIKEAAVSYLGTKFEFGRFYAEKEVNATVSEWHTFGDYFLLRRELIESKIMLRTPDGSRYWKSDIVRPNAQFDDIFLRDITQDDRPVIACIQESCADYKAYSGRAFCDEDINELIDGTALPPNGFKEIFHVKLIEEKAGGLADGYIAYYFGYPDGRTAYVASLFIRSEVRRHGVGTIVVNGIARLAKASGITSLRAAVMTENAPGFAFWTKRGFEKTGVIRPYEDTGKFAAEMQKSL